MSCDYCGSEISGKNLCELCKCARYCTPDCKRMDWFDTHMFFCPSKGPLNLMHFQIQGNSILHIPSNKLFDLVELDESKRQECEIFMSTNHPHITRIYHIAEENRKLKLIVERNYGSLADILHKSLDERQVWKYFTQICTGLFYLKTNSISYSNIMVENMKLDKFNNIKISCFHTPSTDQEDFESLGLVLYQLLHANSSTDMDKELSPEVSDLLELLFNSDCTLTFEDILRHPWVTLHSPTIALSVGQSVHHEKLGKGIIKDIEGLLCCVAFDSCMLFIPTSDLFWTLEIFSVERLMTAKDIKEKRLGTAKALKEEKLYRKLENISRKGTRNFRSASTSQRHSVSSFQSTKQIVKISSRNEQFSGLCQIDEIDTFRKNRPQIVDQKGFCMIFDHEKLAIVRSRPKSLNFSYHSPLTRKTDGLKTIDEYHHPTILNLFGCSGKR